jgi:hypothetical protein
MALLAFGIIVYVNFTRPWLRRKKLLRPGSIYFVIPDKRQELEYINQDNRTHIVTELVLPARQRVQIQLSFEPKLHFEVIDLQFTFTGGDLEKKPRVVEYFNPFVRVGKRRAGSPANDESHYINQEYGYHIRESRIFSVNNTVAYGYWIETLDPGTYTASMVFVGDEVEGILELTVRVEEAPNSEMTCAYKQHKNCKIKPRSVGTV